jgi:hypothetical protein
MANVCPRFQKLVEMLLKRLDGILNCCRTCVRFGVVEANCNIRTLIKPRSQLFELVLPSVDAERVVVVNTEYVAFQKTLKAA